MFTGLLLCMSVVTGCLLAGTILLHYFQLESYQFPGYFRTLRRMGPRAWIPGAVMAAGTFACFLMEKALLAAVPHGAGSEAFFLYPGCALWAAALGWMLYRRAARQPEKKKLVFTPRIKRLYGVCIGAYPIQSEEESTSYPGFDYLFFE